MRITRSRSVGVLLVWLVSLAGVLRAQDASPLLIRATVTAAHWYGDEAIPSETWVLIHPASNTVRIGTITGEIVSYQPGLSLVATTPHDGRLTLMLSIGAWSYSGADGIAVGVLGGG